MLSNFPQLDRMRKTVLGSNPKTIPASLFAIINLKHQVSKSKLGVRERTRSKQPRLPGEGYAGQPAKKST